METEESSISLEDVLNNLKRNANASELLFQESLKRMKQLQRHYTQETSVKSQVPLQPKTRLMKWLTDRDLSVESSFAEFFEAFIDDHKGRLDVSKRTICLNKSACILFGISEPNPTLHIYDVLAKWDVLYM